ncbi:MAG: TrkH family potassium uptake protein [Treponema sp.]|jgi:trk system potassium uptake protein TrkH|nr:TrkH family potassium uptake protein [Treponema sp.]
MRQKRFSKLFILVRVLAVLLGFIPLIMLFPLVMAISLGEKIMIGSFAAPMFITLALSLASIFSLRRKKLHLNAKDGFLLVFLSWVLASLIGAVPFMFCGLGFTDSFFESACSFATTGATTITDIESFPYSLLLWRSIAHWFGGIGIILVSVALLPVLGIGGFQLLKAEETGPEKEKFTPKIMVTAQLLLLAYSSLTFILFCLYLFGGMSRFDALCHSLTTMATGGVSIKNSGLAAYSSVFNDAVTTVFFLLAGINFSIYYRLLMGKFRDILNNTEIKVYIGIFITASLVLTLSLLPEYGSLPTALRYASFHCASIISTAGGAVVNYENWPAFSKMILFILMFSGGCSGSTAGGFKIIRHVVLWKQMRSSMKQLIYPQGVFNIHINKRVGRKDVVYGAAGFLFIYFSLVAIVTLVTALSGVDVFSSFCAALSMTGNIGGGFGIAGPGHNYNVFADHIKWFYSFVMIAGRLELWTVFVLFTAVYWRR